MDVQPEWHIETCLKCGMLFGVPAAFQRQRKDDRATFYCPNGHGQIYAYPAVTDAQRLERLRADLLRSREHVTSLAKSLDYARRAAKASKTRAAKNKC